MAGFEHPWALALLPLCVLPLLPSRGPRRVRTPRPVEADVQRTLRTQSLWTVGALEAAALAVLILAAAGPHLDARPVYDERSARDVVIAIDTSESMRALDFGSEAAPRSRLDGAAELAARFVRAREGDRVGLVAFGGRALTQCPLTFDRDLACWLLEQVRPEMAGSRTALGEAVALGTARLETRGGALVLLSDGENTAGRVTPQQAARAAKARGVRVYAIGIGSEGPVPVPVRMPSGRTVLRQKDYPLDETTLRETAEATGGRYFRASDPQALSEALAEIDRLEGAPVGEARRVPLGRLGSALALAGAALLTLLLIGSSVFLRTVPVLR